MLCIFRRETSASFVRIAFFFLFCRPLREASFHIPCRHALDVFVAIFFSAACKVEAPGRTKKHCIIMCASITPVTYFKVHSFIPVLSWWAFFYFSLLSRRSRSRDRCLENGSWCVFLFFYLCEGGRQLFLVELRVSVVLK